jgi:hypothetical protein
VGSGNDEFNHLDMSLTAVAASIGEATCSICASNLSGNAKGVKPMEEGGYRHDCLMASAGSQVKSVRVCRNNLWSNINVFLF